MPKTVGGMVKRRTVRRQSKAPYICVCTYNMALYKPINAVQQVFYVVCLNNIFFYTGHKLHNLFISLQHSCLDTIS